MFKGSKQVHRNHCTYSTHCIYKTTSTSILDSDSTTQSDCSLSLLNVGPGVRTFGDGGNKDFSSNLSFKVGFFFQL